jgi:uncharacterized protein
MVLEGIVTNVANFGAFVDIGVHQDGLVHVSALSDRFVRDPREVVRAGQLVRVKVIEVDSPRQRIALTMRLADEPKAAGTRDVAGSGARSARSRPAPGESGRSAQSKPQSKDGQTAMQAAFAALKKG